MTPRPPWQIVDHATMTDDTRPTAAPSSEAAPATDATSAASKPEAAPAPPPATTTTNAARVAAFLFERSGALLYQLILALTFGGLLGTTIALVLYGEKNLEVLLGGVGGIALISSLLRWVVAAIPEIDDHHRVKHAKRRVFILSAIATVAVFFAHRWAIRSDFPLIPLGADTELHRRINKLEHELKQVEAQIGAVPMYRSLQESSAWARTWRRIPVRPGQPYALRVEMTDTFNDGWVELLVTDEHGELLAARQGVSNRDVQVIVETADEWSVNAGIRWWPRAMGPLDPEVASALSQGKGAALQLQLVATETPTGRLVAPRPPTVEALEVRSDRTFAVGDDSRAAAGDNLRSRCGGDGSQERLYSLDLSDPALYSETDTGGGWLRVSAESELEMPLVLSLYAETDAPSDGDLVVRGEGGEQVWLREISCDASAVLFEDTRSGARQDILTSTLHVALPRGRYYLAVDGLAVAGRRRLDSTSEKIHRFTLRGAFEPLSRPEPVELRDRALDVRLVDMLAAREQVRCGDRDLAFTSIPVRAPREAGATALSVSLRSLESGAQSGPYSPRLAWATRDEPASTLCEREQASARVSAQLEPGEVRTLRIFRPAPDRYPSVDALTFRVDVPASEALKEACAKAPILELGGDGTYTAATGVSSLFGQISESARPVPKSNAFALARCATDSRWYEPPKGADKGKLNPLNYHPGEDTEESIWRLQLSQPTDLSLLVSAGGAGNGHIFYTSIIATCDQVPQVMMCRQTLAPEKLTHQLRLPAGTYHVIVDGEGSHLLGITPLTGSIQLDPLDPRSDRRAE
ncbi:MAG: hypothetical protein KC420_01750 [Myxococcales bacterium]|nr:hypothetical protein [Myxococcales bacterium]